MSMTDFICEKLKGRTQAEWKEVADACGVPYGTLEKIIYGVTQRPRVTTVEPIFEHLKKIDAEAKAKESA